MAGERSRPYVVLFDPNAVGGLGTSAAVEPGAAQTFRGVASTSSTSGRLAPHAARSVADHVRRIAARSRVRVNAVYRSAVGGFSADLTPSQLRLVASDPAVAEVLPDAAVALDDGSVGRKTAGVVRSVSNPVWQVPAGVRRIGARSPLITNFTRRETQIDADVALLDTGVEPDHPDLNVVGGYNCTSRNHARWDDNYGQIGRAHV